MNGGPGGEGRQVRARLLLLVALALGAYAYQCHLYAHYVNDDAYITFRYSRFLALGRGPYFNPGERVEGYTNPLLMFAMAPVIALGGPDAAPPVAKGIGVVSGALALLAGFWLVRRLALAGGTSRARASLLAVAPLGLVAVDPSFALNAMSGLETLLFSALVTGGVLLGVSELLERRFRGSGLAFAGAALTRPEGAFLFALFWIAGLIGTTVAGRRDEGGGSEARQRYRTLMVNALLVAVAVGALFLFRWIAYDGEWLPNTYYAKAGGFWGIGPAEYVAGALRGTVFGWIGLALGAAGLLAARVPLVGRLPLAAVAAGGLALPLLAGTDWMLGSRLVVPYLPIVAGATVLGWYALIERFDRRGLALGLLLLLSPLAWKLQAAERAELLLHTEVRARGYATGHRALGRWLAATADPGDGVALMDIGIVGYEAIDQRIVDITGLTDREIAKSSGAFLRKEYDVGLVLDRAPRFVVLVFTAPGDPYEPPAPSLDFDLWTPMERKIFRSPEFQARYAARRPPPTDADWLERLAARWGAARVFPHSDPDLYYLLAVFERR